MNRLINVGALLFLALVITACVMLPLPNLSALTLALLLARRKIVDALADH